MDVMTHYMVNASRNILRGKCCTFYRRAPVQGSPTADLLAGVETIRLILLQNSVGLHTLWPPCGSARDWLLYYAEESVGATVRTVVVRPAATEIE